MSTFISGNTVITEVDGEQSIRHYSPGPNEDTVETPDEVDKTPISAEQREALDEAGADTFQPIFEQQPSERADVFTPPADWVSPVKMARRKQAMRLPSYASIADLTQRVDKACRFDGAPAEVTAAATNARAAIDAATEAHKAGRHPDSPRYAVSQTAKDTVVQQIAKATTAVRVLEDVASRDDIREQWFDGLTGDLDKKRAEALKALKAANKAYGSLRATINGAQALAVEQGRWDKSWHTSTVSELELNRPIAALRDAIGYLESGDDYTDGSFLVSEYDGIPDHTIAKLKRGAEVAGGGSFAAQVYARAVRPMSTDRDAQDAISQKRLVLLTNSNPTTAALLGKTED